MITVYTDVYNMRIELEKMKKPIGTKNSPARSCKDLFFGHPQLKDGFYWIDPNLGMSDDAVKVELKETRILGFIVLPRPTNFFLKSAESDLLSYLRKAQLSKINVKVFGTTIY